MQLPFNFEPKRKTDKGMPVPDYRSLPDKISDFILAILRGLLIVLILVMVFLENYPIEKKSLRSQPRPSLSFEESLRRIEALKQSDPGNTGLRGHTIAMHYNKKTDKVIVFFHGFTNSPRQFEDLAEKFFEDGYNVLIPRVPHHGLERSMEKELNRLTAEEMRTLADEAIDIAQGLGDKVIVSGLSMGGVMAGWAAQMRNDIDLAVVIAPCFGTYKLPNRFLKHSINLLHLYPDRFIWWDRELKSDLIRPLNAYRGFSSRALGEIRRLAWMVQERSAEAEPAANKILLITNANDKVVNQESIDVIRDHWQAEAPEKLRTYRFPQALELGHDLIDPHQPNQKTDVVYPKVIELIEQLVEEVEKKNKKK
ncbi:MAG: alpha/beta hydrolase [Candidatus Omnitrophota bacterium]